MRGDGKHVFESAQNLDVLFLHIKFEISKIEIDGYDGCSNTTAISSIAIVPPR